MASLSVYGAYIQGQLVGVLATRNGGAHIALFFVKREYHRQGIGRTLFEAVKKDDMTVNSSPYAQKVYERMGFLRTAEEQAIEGIHFIPMKYSPTIRTWLNCLTEKDTKDAYHALLELENISGTSNILYPYTRMFADMVNSALYVVRVRGFRLFCKQAKWDVNFLLDENIDRTLTILHDPKPTAVRMALAVLQEVLEYKPGLRECITNAVRGIHCEQYKESMQGLIAKDVQRLLGK